MLFIAAQRDCVVLIDDIPIWIADKLLHMLRSFKLFLLPSLVLKESKDHNNHSAKGKKLKEEIENQITMCKDMIRAAREHRLLLTKEANSDASYDKIRLQSYVENIQASEKLKTHLAKLEEDLDHVEFIATSQLSADANGYRGLADWAQQALEAHEPFTVTIAQVSFFGAALIFGTIFSSGNRGNVNLMCYAFSLFNIGFIVSVFTKSLLNWAARCPRETWFTTPQHWNVLICFFNYSAAVVVAAAICLLNVTILQLQFSEATGGATARPAAIISLVFMGIAILIVLITFAMYLAVNGLGTLFDAPSSRRKPRRELEQYTLLYDKGDSVGLAPSCSVLTQ